MNELKKSLIEASKNYFFGEISKYEVKYTASPIELDDKNWNDSSYTKKEINNQKQLSKILV